MKLPSFSKEIFPFFSLIAVFMEFLFEKRTALILCSVFLIRVIAYSQSGEFEELKVDEYVTLDFPLISEVQDTQIRDSNGLEQDVFDKRAYNAYLDEQTLVFIMLDKKQGATGISNLDKYYDEIRSGFLKGLSNPTVLSKEAVMVDSLNGVRTRILGTIYGEELEFDFIVWVIKNKNYILQNIYYPDNREELTITLDDLIPSIKINNIVSTNQVDLPSHEGLAYRLGYLMGRILLFILIVYLILRGIGVLRK